MNDRTLLRLVLLVSCAHALVHMYELSLPGVERAIAADYFPHDLQAGKENSGLLALTWRLPFGLCALAAGWLVDRFGARRLLLVYLCGVSLTCLGVYLSPGMAVLFPVMFVMGLLCSIYHPAGLALISHAANPAQRTRALGMHGIFGSIGISSGPFLATTALLAGLHWQQYYLLLMVPGLLVAFFLRNIPDERDGNGSEALAEDEPTDWGSFYVLTVVAIAQGFVYAGVVSFLPRYMGGWTTTDATDSGGLLTTVVLILGCIGQYLAGRLARPERLERQLTWITMANVPLLLAMAAADGPWRLVAAGLFSIVHFMHQPVYNSLIAKYTPRHRRSLSYGFSFAMGFGVGSSGALMMGFTHRQFTAFAVLAGVALAAGGFGGWLVKRQAQ